MNKTINKDTIIDQAIVDKKRIIAKGQSDRNKIIQSLTPGGPIVGKNKKYHKKLGEKINAPAEEVEKTRERQTYIKENKIDNNGHLNSWRLAVARVREANPAISYKEALKLAAVEYKRNKEYRA